MNKYYQGAEHNFSFINFNIEIPYYYYYFMSSCAHARCLDLVVFWGNTVTSNGVQKPCGTRD